MYNKVTLKGINKKLIKNNLNNLFRLFFINFLISLILYRKYLQVIFSID